MRLLKKIKNEYNNNFVLIEEEKGFYCWGYENYIKEGFPVGQCGTKEDVISQLKTRIETCKKIIREYKEEFSKDNNEIWKVLTNGESAEINACNTFLNILRGCIVWEEIKCNYYDEIKKCTYIDAWKTSSQNEEGKVIAKVYDDGKIEYLHEKAKTDAYAQEVIQEVLFRL